MDEEEQTIKKCVYCCTETVHNEMFVGIRCSNCKVLFLGNETLMYIARKRRENLKLTRQELAEKLNLSVNTISNYENQRVNKKYLDNLESLVKNITFIY